MLEIMVQPDELDLINAAKKDCLLTREERFTLRTIDDRIMTIYSLSDSCVFCSIQESESKWMSRFVVLRRHKDNAYTEVELHSHGNNELYLLSIMCFGEGEVDIKDVHWGAEVFLHITAYNIVHQEYYMVNCRIAVGVDERNQYKTITEDDNVETEWDGDW